MLPCFVLFSFITPYLALSIKILYSERKNVNIPPSAALMLWRWYQCVNTTHSHKPKPCFWQLSLFPVQVSKPSRRQQAYKPTPYINGKLPPTICRRRRQTDCFSTLWSRNRRGWSWQITYYNINDGNPSDFCRRQKSGVSIFLYKISGESYIGFPPNFVGEWNTAPRGRVPADFVGSLI